MLALQLVAPHGQRREKNLLGEAVAGSRPAVVASHSGEVVENLVHPAVFGVQDVLHVIFRFRRCPHIDPAREFDENFEGLIVIGLGFHIEQAGHDFVQGVVRSPDIHAAIQAIEEFGRKSADVAVVVEFGLAFGDSCHQFIGLGFDLGVTRGSVEKRARRQIMPDKMAAQLRFWSFPSAQRQRGGG